MSLIEKVRRKALKEAMLSLRKNRYGYVCRIAQGRFSSIMAVKTPVDRSLVAAKIVAAEDTWPGELEQWKDFSHENVVPLIALTRLAKSNVFFMPVYMTSLKNILHQNEFRSAEHSFQMTKTWIRDVARGLSHLHELEVCHLNIQPSNILIKFDRGAAIGDFGCINTATQPVNQYGLPKEYSPPECWVRRMEAFLAFQGFPMICGR